MENNKIMTTVTINCPLGVQKNRLPFMAGQPVKVHYQDYR